MSRYVHLFVASSSTLEALVSELEPTFGVRIRRIEDGDITRYQHIGPDFALTAYDHDLVNNRDMHFEYYAFAIDVSAGHIRDSEERFKRQDNAAHDVFQEN